jgi:hypothetical protein
MRGFVAVHFCFGRPHPHLVELAGYAASRQPLRWTIDRRATDGDVAVFYLTLPLSAVVAWGTVSGEPALETGGEWEGFHMTDVLDVQLLPRPVLRETLAARVPDWGFLRSPRREIRVPDEFGARVLMALGIRPMRGSRRADAS